MKRMEWTLQVSAIFVALLFTASQALAQAPTLGTSASFGVLGGSTVTNTGASVVRGDLGVSPGGAVTGFPPGLVVGGTTHAADAVALQAQNDVTFAYNGLAGLACNTDLTGQDLGGMTLTPGVYCFSTSAQLTGTLTLNAAGNPAAEFIFQIGSTLTTASNAVVNVINSGSNCNVYWQVGSSATIGTATAFAGNIVALTSITATTGASVAGRLLARNGAVTLDTNSVAVCPLCPPILLAPATLPSGNIGVAYNQLITASGGTAPYTFNLVSGALPPGLTLTDFNPTQGLVSGTPTTAGSYTFTVGATDSVGCFGSRLYTIVINLAPCPVITITPPTLPAMTTGTPFSVQLVASPAGSYTFAVTAGALPPGLTMTTAGLIAGTPTQAGSFTFTVTATDNLTGCIGTIIYSALVGCPVLIIAPATLPAGIIGVPYGPVTITASGGTPPYTISVVGSLPPGMTLSAGGVLAGTPTSGGTFPITILVNDAAGCGGARNFFLSSTSAAGGDTLGSIGLAVLILLLAGAGVFLANRFTL